MKPKQHNHGLEDENCVFCGSTDTTDTTSNMVALDAATENRSVCHVCLNSLEDRQPMIWLRWLKRNNPTHWQKVVEHHRLRSTNLSKVIRRIRIE